MSNKKSKATKRTNAERAAERAAAIRHEQESKERRRRVFVVSAAVFAVFAVVVAIAVFVQSGRDTSGEEAVAPRGVVLEYAVPYGEAVAPVKVAIYEDFMCPFCGQFESASAEMLDGYVDDGDVQVQYHVLSFLDDASAGTEFSTRAMNALGVVLDSSGPETAKRFHDLLFENQPEEGTEGLSDDQLIDFAVQAGAQESDVEKGINDRTFEQWVVNATDQSSKDGIASTPTVLVNGEKVESTTIDELLTNTQDAIDSALAE